MGVLRYPIVVVPGIGGSVLSSPEGVAWDLRGGDVTRNVIDPENLRLDRELTPTRLVDDLVVLRPWMVVPGYAGLNRHLLGQWPNLVIADHPVPAACPAVDVLRVPYDFRGSVKAAADVLGRAVTALVGETGRQVVVVAHSMGGLVARYWIGPGRGWRQCRTLVTLGTPHMGAPRALEWLVNGVALGRVPLRGATRVLRDWPSVHELLPRYSAIQPESGREVGVDALPAEVVRPLGDPAAGATLLRRAAEAATVHRDIDAGWAAIPQTERPTVRVYFGRGHATPSRAVLAGGRLRVTKDDPEWQPNPGWRGDGTVPALASIPDELAENEEVLHALPERHGDMGSTAAIMEYLVTVQGESRKLHGQTLPTRPWLGWDVEEVIAQGEPSEVGVVLQSGAAGPVEPIGQDPTLFVRGPGTRLSVPMTGTGAGWWAALPPLTRGVHSLDVEVKNADRGTSVFGSARTVVVGPVGEES